MLQKYQKSQKRNKGFTLIEIIISLSVFVIVMILVMGSILSVLDINKKAQSEKTAIDNLNFALESMSRTIRFGTNFHCGTTGDVSTPRDCSSGDTSFTVRAADGTLVTYALSNSALNRTIFPGVAIPITSPEIIIQSVAFRVFGSPLYSTGDRLQPQVIITLSGISGAANKPKDQSSFKIETTVSQRKLDI